MTQEEIFKKVQQAVEDVPLMVVGSGSSAAHSIPGMQALGKHLLTKLSEKYSKDPDWLHFNKNISSGLDLETALADIVFCSEVVDDIRRITWELISKSDLDLFYRVVFNQEQLPLSKLVKKFYQPHPQCVNIITTNYDRVIEYACDAGRIPIYTGFEGYNIKYYTGNFANKNAVNLVKVHGSLDFFKDSHESAISLPIQQTIPAGLKADIVTPGISKYQAVLRGTERQLLSKCDSLIQQARAYICIGYGFNDEQIQENIVSGIKAGKPIVDVTMSVSEKAANLLANNATNYISIQKGQNPHTTEFCVNRDITVLEGEFWTISGLLKIID